MPDLYEKIRLLKQSDFFSGVSTDDLRFVAASLTEKVYFAGDIIFQLNDNGTEMYVIDTGKIGISLQADGGEFISTLSTGDCFGEMNLLDGLPRSATAVALEATTLLTLNKSTLHGLLLSYPEISLGILKTLSLRLREANKKIRGGQHY